MKKYSAICKRQEQRFGGSTMIQKRKKLKISIIIIIFIFVLFFAVAALPDIIKMGKREREACKHFEEVCSFAKENENIFIGLPEYQCSLSDDNNEVVIIEREGDMQDKRDIVFKYFDDGSAKIDDNGNVSATYNGHYYSSYEIVLMLSENIGQERTESKEAKIINDDMYLFMIRTRW